MVCTKDGPISIYQFLSRSGYVRLIGTNLKIEYLSSALQNKRMIAVLMKEVINIDYMTALTF
jgi:hypothetical protein